MKNKSKIQTPSTSILNDSNNYSSYLSKDISFNDIKKDSINKYYSRNIIKKQKSRQINSFSRRPIRKLLGATLLGCAISLSMNTSELTMIPYGLSSIAIL